jgi:hypothetical protein
MRYYVSIEFVISYANADSRGRSFAYKRSLHKIVAQKVCKAVSSFEAEESKHRAEFAQHIDDTLTTIEEIS